MVARILRILSPWSPAEALRWLVIGVGGILVWAIAWWFSHREAAFAHQLQWVTLGIAGFIVVAWADVTWLMKARSSIVERRKLLLADVVGAAAPLTEAYGGSLVAGPGLVNFHRSDCVIAVGKNWPEVDRHGAAASGQRPCEMCNP
jgi:hypothetical protein